MKRFAPLTTLTLAFLALTLAACGMRFDSSDPVMLRLYTHNLHAEQKLLDSFVQNIRDAKPDIIALQEVSREAADYLSSRLSEHPYHALQVSGDPYTGMAIFSRYPIVAQRAWPLPRRLMRAEINVSGRLIVVYDVHPTSPGNTGLNTAPRSRDVAFALEDAAQTGAPTLLMGDFNMEDGSDDYRKVAKAYTDVYRATNKDSGVTYPDYSQPQARVNARLPGFTPLILRLDYLFASADFQPVEAKVWPSSGGSDHRPVVGTVKLG
jgi:endonuclease/exonuclease/phosphatase family metal-dependent hydrolase